MIKEDSLSTMKQFQVDYETTLPPWHYGHEEIEAEDITDAKEKFCIKHESARLLKVYIVNTDNSGKS